MPSFTDSRKITFTLDIKQRDVIKIKALLKDSEGEPLDLLELADTGNLWKIFGSSQLMLDMIFLLCLPQIDEHFVLADFDKTHEDDLSLIPELASSLQKKKAYWFAEGIGPEQIPEITKAFKEAIVNFTPNPHQRAALEAVLENQEALTQAQAQRAIRISNSRREKIDAELEKQANQEIQQLSAAELLKQI